MFDVVVMCLVCTVNVQHNDEFPEMVHATCGLAPFWGVTHGMILAFHGELSHV